MSLPFAWDRIDLGVRIVYPSGGVRMASSVERALIDEVERMREALQEEQAESLRQAEIARDALAEVERLQANLNGCNGGRELLHREVERLQARVRELEAPARALVNHLWTAPEPVTSGDLIRLLRTLGDVLDQKPLAAVSAEKEES